MNTVKYRLLTTLVASLMALTACSQKPADPATTDTTQATTQADTQATAGEQVATGTAVLHTADGEKSLAKNPNPLAVYDMTAMQNLSAIGVAVQGMPDLTEDRIALINLRADGVPPANSQIGTLFEPNLESLNALKPQAVFVGSRMAEKMGELSQIAPTYNLTIDTKDVYNATKQQLTDFGVLFGKEELASQKIAEIDKAINDAKTAIAGRGNGLAILINGNKMSAYGKDSRYGFLHTTLGIPMADEYIKEARHGQPITFEYIQKLDPDWLFVLDRTAAVGEEGVSAQEFLNNPLMHNTKAYKNNQIVYLSPDSYLAFGGYYQWLKDTKLIMDAVNKTAPTQSADQPQTTTQTNP